jgi:TRAP-type C4-dicarboxylate transport system substrate-binding protein
MKRRASGIIFIVALMLVTALMVQPNLAWTKDKPVKLKVGNVFPPPETSLMSEILQTWENEVTKRTNGLITFETFWGCALGSPPEHSELVKMGTAQVCQFHEWYTPGKFPLGDFEYVFPFGPTDYVIVAKANRQIRQEFPEFYRDHRRQNIIQLCDPPGGVYDFLSKIPVRTLKDFEGQKVSLIGRYFGKWLPPGATAVVRLGHERYDLLRAGVVKIDLLPFDLLYAFKLHEQTKYYIKTDLISCCWNAIHMNLDTFNSFSPEIQKILLEIGPYIELKAATEIIPRWQKKIYKDWKEAGIETIVFPEEEKMKWVQLIPDTAAEWAEDVEKKGYPGFKIVQRWQEITADMGYKWPRKWGEKK